MTERVSWVNELAVKAGKLQTFKELMEEMVSGARNQPGTLAYEWYISPDGGTVHVVETYADSAAVVAHHLSEGSRGPRPPRRHLPLRLGRLRALLTLGEAREQDSRP
jgi:quinol monooxygenase YgiN